MSREGAIIFGDLEGKLPVLQVSCTKCPHRGRYILHRLIRAHAKVVDWLDVINADCPKRVRQQHERSVRCAVPGFAEGALVRCYRDTNRRFSDPHHITREAGVLV
jgi:hypothetical protein